jgi:hypothetical protein
MVECDDPPYILTSKQQYGNTESYNRRCAMPSRQRAVMTLSVPPLMATEYRRLAKEKGENASEFFREIFTFYKQQKLKIELASLQQYGAAKARETCITEEDIEALVFGDRQCGRSFSIPTSTSPVHHSRGPRRSRLPEGRGGKCTTFLLRAHPHRAGRKTSGEVQMGC